MDKLSQIDSKINAIQVTLSEQHATLQEHMRRTEALESQTDELKKFIFEVKGAFKLISAALIIIEVLSKFWH